MLPVLLILGFFGFISALSVISTYYLCLIEQRQENPTVLRRADMTKTFISQVICIRDRILIVFYTEDNSWQFRVVNSDGKLSKGGKLFYSAEAAEKAGRNWIALKA